MTLKEAMISSFDSVVNERNSHLIFAWDEAYLKPLLDLIISKHYDLKKENNHRHCIALEEFVSRLIYYQPYFLEKAAKMFENYGLKDCPTDLLIKRLEVLNILVLVDRFPV